VRSAKLSAEPITQGADTTFIGFNSNSHIKVAKTKVTGIIATVVPPNPLAPRYRAINLDAITLETGLAAHCSHGVLINSDGFVRALWINYLGEGEHVEYHYGLPISRLLHVISKIRTGVIPTLRILDMEPRVLEMSEAPIMGMSDKRIQQAALVNLTRPQFFQV
jgi:pro-apoptotic serine protease NMA111